MKPTDVEINRLVAQVLGWRKEQQVLGYRNVTYWVIIQPDGKRWEPFKSVREEDAEYWLGRPQYTQDANFLCKLWDKATRLGKDYVMVRLIMGKNPDDYDIDVGSAITAARAEPYTVAIAFLRALDQWPAEWEVAGTDE